MRKNGNKEICKHSDSFEPAVLYLECNTNLEYTIYEICMALESILTDHDLVGYSGQARCLN